MTKPSKTRLQQLYGASAHKRSKHVGACLSAELRSQYGTRTVRVTRGDSIKVVRGEYKGVEGKVNKVHTESGRLAIEGIQREKVRGGNVPVLIHSSKVVVVGLNTDDKWRLATLERKRSE